MTGADILIAAIFIVLVVSFIITMVVLNNSAKRIIATNTKLVVDQNTLLEQNKMHSDELEKRINELEEQLKCQATDKVTLLREQTRQHREHIKMTADMTDEELMMWIDEKMDETRLFTDTNLTLKTMAKALGLTQRRLGGLFRNNEKYSSLGDYINEKRFLLACRLLREEPQWTIEAVGREAGFGGRRTFQTEVKRRLGITPLQYRQCADSIFSPKEAEKQTDTASD